MFQSRNRLFIAARLSGVTQHRFCSASFIQKKIEMPKFMDGTVGCVEKWLKKEGESFHAGETICEVTIDGVTLGIDQKEPGIVAEILVNENLDAAVGKNLAIIVDGKEAYEAFVAKFKKLDDGALPAEVEDSVSVESTDGEPNIGTEATPDVMHTTNSPTATSTSSTHMAAPNITLIRTVKHLIKTDVINEADDFAHDLLSLCRQGHTDLLEAFDASYDGDEFNEATFDADFFIGAAKSIVSKHNIQDAR